MTIKALDLFAGPGGWEVPDSELGIQSWGIEFDKAACATREAAGLQTQCADVREVTLLPRHGFQMLKASPPCQTFSAAGNGSGRKALDVVLAELHRLVARFRGVQTVNGAWGFRSQTEWIRYDKFEDVRTGLVLEPLRYILAAICLNQPFRTIALEQVPAVLPVWAAYATVLEEFGYSVAYGNVQAEQYGAPQTRKRAVLLASLDSPMSLPKPTHSKFHTRSPERLDAGVKPWVSMADALGTTPGGELRSNYGTGGDPAARGIRISTEPAPTITSKIDRNKWLFAGAGQTAGQIPRGTDLPAHTVTGKATAAWVQRRNSGPGAAREPRPVEDAPSYTIRVNGSGSHPSGTEWVYRNGNQAKSATRAPEEPAPTVMFGARSNKVEWMPEAAAADPAASGVRVTVEEAACLQTFPADYPWQGTKTQQYQQVGNAIPPLLAKALLKQVMG